MFVYKIVGTPSQNRENLMERHMERHMEKHMGKHMGKHTEKHMEKHRGKHIWKNIWLLIRGSFQKGVFQKTYGVHGGARLEEDLESWYGVPCGVRRGTAARRDSRVWTGPLMFLVFFWYLFLVFFWYVFGIFFGICLGFLCFLYLFGVVACVVGLVVSFLCCLLVCLLCVTLLSVLFSVLLFLFALFLFVCFCVFVFGTLFWESRSTHTAYLTCGKDEGPVSRHVVLLNWPGGGHWRPS